MAPWDDPSSSRFDLPLTAWSTDVECRKTRVESRSGTKRTMWVETAFQNSSGFAAEVLRTMKLFGNSVHHRVALSFASTGIPMTVQEAISAWASRIEAMACSLIKF